VTVNAEEAKRNMEATTIELPDGVFDQLMREVELFKGSAGRHIVRTAYWRSENQRSANQAHSEIPAPNLP